MGMGPSSSNAGLKGGASARTAPQLVSDAQATAYPPTISAVDFVARPPLRPLGQPSPGAGQVSVGQPLEQMPPQSFGGMPPQAFGQMSQMQPFQPPPAQLERLQSLQQQFTNTDAFRNFDRMTPEQRQAASMGGDPFANIPEFQAMNAAQQEIAQQQQQYNQQQQMMQQQAQQQMMQELMMLRQQQAERQRQSIQPAAMQPAASPAAQPITPTQQRLSAQRLSSARQRRGIAGLLPPRPAR
jgi:hypothetical protein